MPRTHKVEQGDTIASIARPHGHLPETIWNHADNAKLKAQREDPDVLNPGDMVAIPDVTTKSVTLSTGQRHRYVRKGAYVVVRIRLLVEDEPQSGVNYTLKVGDALLAGSTDTDGVLEQRVPAEAREALLTLENDSPIRIALGALDPKDTVSGVQGRLHNLGYFGGHADGHFGEDTRAAWHAFQQDHGLAETDEPDESTLQRLSDEHGI